MSKARREMARRDQIHLKLRHDNCVAARICDGSRWVQH